MRCFFILFCAGLAGAANLPRPVLSPFGSIRNQGAKPLYEFLLQSHPAAQGAREFFERLTQESGAREVVNELLKDSPQFQEALETGKAYRQEYQSTLSNLFGETGFVRDLVEAPEATLARSYAAFLAAQRVKQDTLIRPNIANQRARANTIHLYQLPENISEVEFFNNVDAWEFYRKERPRRENDTEIRPRRPDYLNDDQLRTWKALMKDKFDQVRLQILKKALTEHLQDRKLIFRPGTKPDTIWGWLTGGKRKLGKRELDTLEIRFKKPSSSETNLTKDDSGVSQHLLRESSQLLGTALMLPNYVLREIIDPSKEHAARELTTLPRHREDTEIEISFIPGGSKSKSKRVQFTLPFDKVFFDSFFPRLNNIEQERTSINWLDTNKQPALISGLFQINTAIASLERFLQPAKAEDGEAFAKRLVKLPKRQTNGGVLSPRLHPVARDSADAVANLEWYGYSLGPNYWKLRDELAGQKKAPELSKYLEAKLPPKWRVRMADKLAKLDPIKRAAVLWGLFSSSLGLGYGTYEAARHLPELPGWISSLMDSHGKDGVLANPNGIKIQEPTKAYNKKLGDGFDKSHPLYLLDALNGREAPIYYDFIGKDPTGLRFGFSTSDTLMTRAPVSLIISSNVPHYRGDENEVALPSVDNHQLMEAQVFELPANRRLNSIDFEIRRDPLSKVYYLQLSPDKEWPLDASFRFRLHYSPRPELIAHETPLFHDLDHERLRSINRELEDWGFQALARELDALIDNPLRRPNLEDLAHTFANSGVYDSEPEGEPRKDLVEGTFGEFQHFLKDDGKAHYQCDGFNQHFALYLRKYFQDNPDVSVENQLTWVRQHPDKITGSDGHLRTLVATRDGKYRWLLDATGPDPKKAVSQRKPMSPQWSAPEIEIPLYFERRPMPKPERDQEKEPVPEDPPPEEGPKVAADKNEASKSDLHAQRVQEFRRLKEALWKNPAFKALPRALVARPSFPTQSLLSLGEALLELSGGRISESEFFEKAHRLYSQIPRHGLSAKELPERLGQIFKQQKNTMIKIAQRVDRGEMKEYLPMVNPELWESLENIQRFYGKTDWSPVDSSCDTQLSRLQ